MKKGILLLLTACFCYFSSAQLLAGASFGTFNLPNARLRHFVPTAKLEYIYTDGASIYLEGSLASKKRPAGTETVQQPDGTVAGTATIDLQYSVVHTQLGFKRFLGRLPEEEGLAFFLGGGGAFSFYKKTYSYSLPGYAIDDSKLSGTSYGFHFSTGVQYNIKKLIVDLKGNFDIMLKPVLENESHIVLGTRLGVLIPVTKY
jgi:hypothetical protein